jgi:hypothetical protein
MTLILRFGFRLPKPPFWHIVILLEVIVESFLGGYSWTRRGHRVSGMGKAKKHQIDFIFDTIWPTLPWVTQATWIPPNTIYFSTFKTAAWSGNPPQETERLRNGNDNHGARPWALPCLEEGVGDNDAWTAFDWTRWMPWLGRRWMDSN